MVWHLSGDHDRTGNDHPAVGFNLFVIQALSGHSIGDDARADFPLFLLMRLAAADLAVFPQIVTIGPEVPLGS